MFIKFPKIGLSIAGSKDPVTDFHSLKVRLQICMANNLLHLNICIGELLRNILRLRILYRHLVFKLLNILFLVVFKSLL